MQIHISIVDILRGNGGNDGDALTKAWTETATAGEMGPLPAGEFVARIIASKLMTSPKSGTTATPLPMRRKAGA